MKTYFAASLAVALLAGAAFAQNACMQVTTSKGEKVRGDCREPGHQNWIAINQVSFEATPAKPGSTVAARPTRPSAGQVKLMRNVDLSSPFLKHAEAAGEPFKEVVIDLFRGTGAQAQAYERITLKDAMISSIQVAGAGEKPTEHVTFSYREISRPATPQTMKPAGTIQR